MFKEYIERIIYFIICTILIELIIPANKYKKYFDLCKGFILIIVILNPILSILSTDFNENSINLSDMYFLEKKELNVSKDVLTKRQSDMILKVYVKNLESKIKELLKEMDIKLYDINININEERKNEKFGDIEKIELVIGIGNKHRARKNDDTYYVNEIKGKLLYNFSIQPEKIYIQRLGK